jgi:hypothetical protein
MGMTAEGRSLVAVFPLDVLNEEHEVHIIYDSGVHDGGEHKYCGDCYTRFKLDDVRSVEKQKYAGPPSHPASTGETSPTSTHPVERSPAEPPGREDSAQAADDGDVPPNVYFVVDSRTGTYVHVSCPSANQIPTASRLYYRTESAASKAGHRPSTLC